MNIDPKTSWKDTLEIIKVSVSPAIFSTWFSKTHIASLNEVGDRVVVEIGCPTSFAKNTIESRYFGLIQDSLNKVVGKTCDVTFIVKENLDKVEPSKETEAPLFENKKDDREFIEVLRTSRIKPSFTFENFAVSGSNQMAHAAALAVSESLGTAYNPLFIWGGVGVGKTHLMQAVGHSTLLRDPHSLVLSCTAEDFTNDIIDGIRNKTTPEVRKKYRKLNLLMVDDIQFIAGKETAQEEFFHTFNAVTSAGGQVIMTADKPPSEIFKLEDRLRSRFEAGLIVDVSPPDFELKCAIVQIKSQERKIPLEMDQIQMIAANTEGARNIEGVLIKIMNEVHLKKLPITKDLVEGALSHKEEINGKASRSTPEQTIEAVCKYYQIGKRLILSDTRARQVARPRQMLMYLLRTQLGIAFEEVGRLVGNRDHSTVMHAVNKITQLATTDVHIREDMLKIKNTL
ncbi:MAG TPA: chromosomal replication initiator protein DnaA [Patescibacteria group bacterium]|nr:chromosomal replication initiator protein DnaA [Patescibacteria group bacterium]